MNLPPQLNGYVICYVGNRKRNFTKMGMDNIIGSDATLVAPFVSRNQIRCVDLRAYSTGDSDVTSIP